MAKAKECDLCKNFYKVNIENKQDAFDLLDTDHLVFLAGKPKLPLTKITLYSDAVSKDYDVCDECGEKIIKFIKGFV